jgi:hypothetical protein
MQNIKVKSLGPIEEADITFGDLTFFIGPQASGKSLLLQMIKLAADKPYIANRVKNYSYVWGTNEDDNLERFFGEGTAGIWNKRTAIKIDDVPYHKNSLLPNKPGSETGDKETVFYIPAQRVVCLNYGWPRFFSDFEDSAPFVLRDFSETLRKYLDMGFGHRQSPVFPQSPERVNGRLTDSFNESIFRGAEIMVEADIKKRLKLNINNVSLPFMAWSTGQKESMPLLMGFYYLSPKSKGRRADFDMVIIEEPEMGLHPEAIKSVILQIIELMSRGYRVIVSTHSPVFMEFAWAFNILKEAKADDEALLELFNLHKDTTNEALFKGVLNEKTVNTYFFDNVDFKVTVKNISGLDAGDADPAVAEWGGLSSFASKANDIVATIAANNG